MKQANFKYFINGEEVDGEYINWKYSTSIINKGSEIHVEYDPKDVDNIYGVLEEHKESDLQILCGILSLAGMGAIPGVELKENTLSNLTQPDQDCEGGVERFRIESSGRLSPGVTNPTAKLHVSGVKHNKFKAPLDIVQTRQFPKALQLIALATAFGNKKYEATDKDFLNFKRVAGGSQTYFDAAARHNAERDEVDEDSGLPHIIHSVWDSLAALEIWAEEKEVDIKEFSKKYLEYLHISK